MQQLRPVIGPASGGTGSGRAHPISIPPSAVRHYGSHQQRGWIWRRRDASRLSAALRRWAMTFIERRNAEGGRQIFAGAEGGVVYSLCRNWATTRADSWVDIRRGIGTAFTSPVFGSASCRTILWPEDELIPAIENRRLCRPPRAPTSGSPARQCISTL